MSPTTRSTASTAAPNAEIIREHATKGGFPANSIQEVRTVIDPTTAE
jgi:hypothetical protein